MHAALITDTEVQADSLSYEFNDGLSDEALDTISASAAVKACGGLCGGLSGCNQSA